MWKVKQLIKKLTAARETVLDDLVDHSAQGPDLVDAKHASDGVRYGIQHQIKSESSLCLSAIVSTQQRLKLYSKVPPNGLVMYVFISQYYFTYLKLLQKNRYCGTVITDEGKERKVTIDFEPYKPINTSLYLCDNKFHTEDLGVLLEDSDRFGFVVMDGNGCLFGTLCGNHREILHKFSVDLPKKHGRGGQSALRFARLRLEKRRNYVRKCGVDETVVHRIGYAQCEGTCTCRYRSRSICSTLNSLTVD